MYGIITVCIELVNTHVSMCNQVMSRRAISEHDREPPLPKDNLCV